MHIECKAATRTANIIVLGCLKHYLLDDIGLLRVEYLDLSVALKSLVILNVSLVEGISQQAPGVRSVKYCVVFIVKGAL